MGLEAHYLDFRLPYFVRSSEAVMAPKRFQTKQQFMKRGQKLLNQLPKPLFVSRRTDIGRILDDIFEIRNGCAHGMPFGWKVKGRVKAKRRMEQYAYLAEECSRRALKFALGNNELLKASLDRTDLEDWCEKHWV